MIRVLLVDDHTIIRQGLANLLASQPDLQVVGDAANGQEAIDLVCTLHGTSQQPDVVLMDVRMPVVDGVAATKQICADFSDVKILVLTTFDDTDYVQQAMRWGAKGYLLKQTPIEVILPEKLKSLSPREQEVLQLIMTGLSNREIGENLFIAERTVRNHVTSILSQLQLRDRTQAALYASQFWPQRLH